MNGLPERLLTPDLLLRPPTEDDGLPERANSLSSLRVIQVRSSGRIAGHVGDAGSHLDIELHPSHRGRGRGSEALSAWLGAALDRGDPVRLEAQNDTARDFLRKFGFEQDGRQWKSTGRTRDRVRDMMEAQRRRYRQRVHMCMVELGIPGDFGALSELPLVYEARCLDGIGHDIFDRPQFMAPEAAAAWHRLRAAAESNGIDIRPVSAFRGFDYQIEIVRRKMDAGQSIEQILAVSAAPGYSQHHGGLAIDIGVPGEEPLTEAFEDTDAFRWLCDHALEFGFRLSYPRDNPHGLAYEPWHWQFTATADGPA